MKEEEKSPSFLHPLIQYFFKEPYKVLFCLRDTIQQDTDVYKKYNIILVIFITIIAAIILISLPRDIPRPSLAAATGSPAITLPQTTLPLSERLNSTYLLLHEPIGGFHGPQMWIAGPDNVTFDYTFYSRDYGPGNITFTIYEVSSPLNITPITPSPGISARMIPDHFTAPSGHGNPSAIYHQHQP